jgi:hypothetical protein
VAVAWLEAQLTASPLGIRKRDVQAAAKAADIDAAALGAAAKQLKLREVDGAFLFGSRSSENGVPYWRRSAPARFDRAAAVTYS